MELYDVILSIEGCEMLSLTAYELISQTKKPFDACVSMKKSYQVNGIQRYQSATLCLNILSETTKRERIAWITDKKLRRHALFFKKMHNLYCGFRKILDQF